MKKYNSYNFKWLLIWIIVPILLFFIAMGSVYAYFTASAKEQRGDSTTAIIRIGFSENTSTSIVNSNDIITTNVLPGSTIVISGSVVNNGTMPVYALLEFIITIDGEIDELEHSYFTASGTELVSSNNTYSTGATQIVVGTKSDFSLQYTFDFNQFDNNYKGRKVNIELIAHAIQVKNINSAVDATNIIMESLNI